MPRGAGNKMDDLVKAAIDYADDALGIAEELLDKWYEASLESACVSARSPRQYEAELQQISAERDKYRQRLMKMREK